MQELKLGVSGRQVVCCLHDRQKRQVTTVEQVIELGKSVGQVYDPQQHKLWSCACCENLFVDPSDEPRYCRKCQGTLIHMPAGPLPAPNERPLDG